MDQLATAAYARAAILAPFFSSSKVMVFAFIVTYVSSEGDFTAEMAFMVLAMYNSCRLTLNLFVPFAIQFMAESKITLERVKVSGKFPLRGFCCCCFISFFWVL